MLTVSLLKIPVTDLERSLAFYQRSLGLRAVSAAIEYGWAQMEGAGIPLALYVPGRGGGNRSPGGSLDFHLEHDRLEVLIAVVRQVQPAANIFENGDGSRSLEFLDPDGNLIKVMERRPAADV